MKFVFKVIVGMAYGQNAPSCEPLRFMHDCTSLVYLWLVTTNWTLLERTSIWVRKSIEEIFILNLAPEEEIILSIPEWHCLIECVDFFSRNSLNSKTLVWLKLPNEYIHNNSKSSQQIELKCNICSQYLNRSLVCV